MQSKVNKTASKLLTIDSARSKRSRRRDREKLRENILKILKENHFLKFHRQNLMSAQSESRSKSRKRITD